MTSIITEQQKWKNDLYFILFKTKSVLTSMYTKPDVQIVFSISKCILKWNEKERK